MPAFVRRFSRSWWFVAPPLILLAAMHAWSFTFARYLTGEVPRPFGLDLRHGTDGWLMMLLALAMLLLAAAVWIAIAILITLYSLLAHRRAPPHELAWKSRLRCVCCFRRGACGMDSFCTRLDPGKLQGKSS
jgi:hypothetical protein